MSEKPKPAVEFLDTPEDLKKAVIDLAMVIEKHAHKLDRGSVTQHILNTNAITLQVIAQLANITMKVQMRGLIELANKDVKE